MQDREIRLNVADVIISLAIEPGVRVAGHVDSFLADEAADAVVNMRFNHEDRRSEVWHPLSGGDVFGWHAFVSADGGSILVERRAGSIRVHFASSPECKHVDVLLGAPCLSNRLATTGSDGGWLERELLLVEVLPLPVVVLLAGRKGLFLHSCAVALGEEGILFSGVSGSGKSTMAELWRKFGPLTSRVIDDEHILARQVGQSVLLFGAPWSRGARAATFSRTPLRAIFFLVHGKQNQCVRLSSGEAFAELLSQVFLPLWSKEQLELVMQTCAELLQGVACYRLHFVPDDGIIAFVQDALGDSQ